MLDCANKFLVQGIMQERFQAPRIQTVTCLVGLSLLTVFTSCEQAMSEELTAKSDAKSRAIQIGISKIGSVVLDRNRWIVIGRRKDAYVELKLDTLDGHVIAEDRLEETPEYDRDESDLVTKCNPNIGVSCSKKTSKR